MHPAIARLWPLRWRLGAALAIVAAVGAVALPRVAGPRTETVKVERRDIVESVVASGRVATPNRVEIGTQVVGTVAEVPVGEGSSVKAGQTLILLESSEARALVRQAEVAVAQGEARLRQLRELQLPVATQGLRQAEANFANAQAQLERNRRLHQSGYVGKSILDEAQRAHDVAQTQVDTARKQVETARATGSDYALASAALEQAHASLAAARSRLAYSIIAAPVDGTLIARDVERGDVVQPGKALLVLAPAGETQIVVQIDERNLGRLRIGQPALASADAYPAERFAAEVVYINPGIDAQRGTVEVKLRVASPPAYLRQDMTVSVDIETGRRPQALALAAAAVRDPGSAAPWVLALRDGRAVRQTVRLGLRGEGVVEVLEGLAENERALLGNRVQPGERVRAAGS